MKTLFNAKIQRDIKDIKKRLEALDKLQKRKTKIKKDK